MSTSETRSVCSLDGVEINSTSSGDNHAHSRKMSQSTQSMTSLLSAAMDALNSNASDRGDETKTRAALGSNSSGVGSDDYYSSDEENLAQAQEDDRIMAANGSVASSESESVGLGVPAQIWTFSCQDLLDMVLENMSQEAEMILAERGLSSLEGKQGKKIDYLTVEALATHRNNVTSAVGSNPNLQTFIAGLPPTAQLDSKGSVISSISGGGAEGYTTTTSKSPSTPTTSPLPPLPSQVVPNVLPLVGTREEYMLMAAEDDGSIMDDLPPFKMQANVTTVGVNDFVVVKKQGDTIMMHVRIEEKENYSKPTYGAMRGININNNVNYNFTDIRSGSQRETNSQVNFPVASKSIAITPGSQQGSEGKPHSGAEISQFSSFDGSSAYRYFAPAILGNRVSSSTRNTNNTNNTNSASNNPTSASRTFASYLGWPSTIAASSGNINGREHSGDYSITGGSMDGGSVFSGCDSEGKEERLEDMNLPAEFDDYAKNRYFDHKSTRRSMSITEGMGWIKDKDGDVHSQINHSGGRGKIRIKIRKPSDSQTDWRNICEVIISAQHSGDTIDVETTKASYEALLREEHLQSGEGTDGDVIPGNTLLEATKPHHPNQTKERPLRGENTRDIGELDEDLSLASLSSQDDGCYEIDAATGEAIVTSGNGASASSLRSQSPSEKRGGNPALDDPFGMSMDD